MKTIMKKTQKSFSLVELIVVIAIIAILAAVAIPMYSNYTTKAKVSTALASIGSLKTTISEENTAIGTGAGGNVALAGVTAIAAAGDGDINGTDFTTEVTTVTGVITMVFTAPVSGTLTLTPTIGQHTINWVCAATGTGFSTGNVPSNCAYT